VASLPAVWSFADVANGLMAVPNLISLLWLNRVLVAETRRYLWEPGAEGATAVAQPAATTR
jgi:AGCS family alanine or glycine:cation symporter